MPQPKKHNSHAERQAAYRSRQEAAQAALAASKGMPPLPAIANMPGWVRWRRSLEHASLSIRGVHGEMQAYYDDRSEAWLESDKGDAFVECMETVEELCDHVDECRSCFD